jgi:mRNA-decapping enzyme subunit 2
MTAQEQQMTLADALMDIEMRFLNNLPQEEAAQMDRLFFQLEQAYWFYEDFYADNYEHLPHIIMGRFSQMIVEQSDVLHLNREQVTQLMQGGKKYLYQQTVNFRILRKPQVPRMYVCGCLYGGCGCG